MGSRSGTNVLIPGAVIQEVVVVERAGSSACGVSPAVRRSAIVRPFSRPASPRASAFADSLGAPGVFVHEFPELADLLAQLPKHQEAAIAAEIAPTWSVRRGGQQAARVLVGIEKRPLRIGHTRSRSQGGTPWGHRVLRGGPCTTDVGAGSRRRGSRNARWFSRASACRGRCGSPRCRSCRRSQRCSAEGGQDRVILAVEHQQDACFGLFGPPNASAWTALVDIAEDSLSMVAAIPWRNSGANPSRGAAGSPSRAVPAGEGDEHGGP